VNLKGDSDWFEEAKRKMQEESGQEAASRAQESRSRFLLESFREVFLETLSLAINFEQQADEDKNKFQQLVDQSLLTASKVVAEMKQLTVDSTTVLTSPTVSIEVEETAKHEQLKAAVASSKLAGFTKEQLEQRPARKPPASDR
jgi:DNA replication protein DnaD